MTAALAPPRLVDPREGKLPSVWMVLSRRREFFERPNLLTRLSLSGNSPRAPLLWTDDYSSILPILR
jgi:hypothetical protein